MSELKSSHCPFCGSADISDGEALVEKPDGSTYAQSMCNDCGALGPLAPLAEGEIDYGDVKAIAAWNRRASAPASGSVPNGWCIELLDHGMWRISSPSGDGVHIKLDDPRPISEMFRQLCQSLTEQQEGK